MKQEQLATETEERYLAREDRLANTRQRVANRPSKSDRQLLLDTALCDTKNGGSHERQ